MYSDSVNCRNSGGLSGDTNSDKGSQSSSLLPGKNMVPIETRGWLDEFANTLWVTLLYSSFEITYE